MSVTWVWGMTPPGVERDAGEGVQRGLEVEVTLLEIVESLRDEGVEQRGRVATLRRCRLPWHERWVCSARPYPKRYGPSTGVRIDEADDGYAAIWSLTRH